MKTVKKVLLLLILSSFFNPVYSWEDKRLEMWARNLKHKNILIRKSAAKNLGSLGDKEAIPYLLEALKDEETEVRVEACNSLGLIGEESVKKKLTQVLYNDSSPMVKDAAKRAIDEIDAYLEKLKEDKLKEMKQKLKEKSSNEEGAT